MRSKLRNNKLVPNRFVLLFVILVLLLICAPLVRVVSPTRKDDRL